MPVQDLIRRWRAPLIGLIAGWGAPWGDAEELASDALAEAWVGRARFEGDLEEVESVGPWLRGIAFRLHATWRRKRARTQSETDPAETIAAAASDEDPYLAELRAAIDELPENQRTAVLVHYLDEHSVRETAALLEINETAVEGRLYRARVRLRELLGKQGIGRTGEARR